MVAIVEAPALSLRARGKVGAINYSESRGIAIARADYSPVQPGTSAQVAIQVMLKSASKKWSTLTKYEVEEWRQRARQTTLTNRLGQKYNPNAFNLFCSRNMNLLKIGESMISVPGARQSNDVAIRLYTISAGGGYFSLAVEWLIASTTAPIVRYSQYAGPFDSANRQPQQNEWVDGFITPKNTTYTSHYGFTTNKYWWARSQCVYDNGEVSCYTYCQHYVT